MRKYLTLERYLNQLLAAVYDQPPDPGHQAAIEDVAQKWISRLDLFGQTVLDVGCGQGQAISVLNRYCQSVIGVTLGNDAQVAQEAGYDVRLADMTFLDQFPDNSFQLVFSRHSLEHSPMPLLTLMEWHRVSRQWLLLIVPDGEYFGYSGQNHYYVLTQVQWRNLLEQAGWRILWHEDIADPPVPEFRLIQFTALA